MSYSHRRIGDSLGQDAHHAGRALSVVLTVVAAVANLVVMVCPARFGRGLGAGPRSHLPDSEPLDLRADAGHGRRGRRRRRGG